MSKGSSSERTVTRNFLKLGLGEILARLIAFAATIYIARVLGPESYGIVGFALAITLYFSWFTDFGIEDLAPRELARDPARIRDLAPSLVAARTLIAIVCAAGLAVFSWLFMPQPDAAVLAVCAGYSTASRGWDVWRWREAWVNCCAFCSSLHWSDSPLTLSRFRWPSFWEKRWSRCCYFGGLASTASGLPGTSTGNISNRYSAVPGH